MPPVTRETTAPVRPVVVPQTSTPRPVRACSTRCPGPVSARGPNTRASPAEGHHPGRDVGGLAAGRERDPGRGVVVGHQRARRLDDHVEHHVSQTRDQHVPPPPFVRPPSLVQNPPMTTRAPAAAPRRRRRGVRRYCIRPGRRRVGVHDHQPRSADRDERGDRAARSRTPYAAAERCPRRSPSSTARSGSGSTTTSWCRSPRAPDVVKTSVRDLGPVLAQGLTGATTVAATAYVAHLCRHPGLRDRRARRRAPRRPRLLGRVGRPGRAGRGAGDRGVRRA